MLNIFKTTKIEPLKILIAVIIIIVGDWGVMTAQGENLLSVFNFTFLAITGLVSLTIVLGRANLKILFRKMSKGDWKWVGLAIIAEIILTYAFAFIGYAFKQSLANNAAVGDSSPLDVLVSFPFTAISLIGEELLIATLFILVYILFSKTFTEKQTVIIATVASLTIFGLSHYGVYDGNLYQCIVVIGLAHIPAVYAWLKTETLWVPIAIHIIYDFLLIGITSLA